jgi:DNA polymerase-3 subunit gamma/tau
MSEVPYQSLYRRYRPQRFAEVRGQDHITTALRNAVRADRVGHAYLFSGPRGTGKTSTARILAKALNCTNLDDGEPCGVCESCLAIQAGTSLDVVELDAASNNGVDAMRDLVARAALGSPGRRKVYIVDEVHMLSAAASNALLKTLEEPPAHVVFVLATTDPQKVLATIRSRTQPFEFHLLGPGLLSSLLQDVNDRAGLHLDPTTLDRVVRRGNGSARDALSALDQAVAAGGAEDETDIVPAVVDALADRDIGAALVAVAQAVQRGRDPRRLAEEMVEHLRSAFLVTMAPGVSGVPDEARQELAEQARRLGAAALVRAMEVLGEALVDMREALDTRVTLEVALIRLCAVAADTSAAAIVQRLEALERALHAPTTGGVEGGGGVPPARGPEASPVAPQAPPPPPARAAPAPPPPAAAQPSALAPDAATAAASSAAPPAPDAAPDAATAPAPPAPAPPAPAPPAVPGTPASAPAREPGAPRPTIGAVRQRGPSVAPSGVSGGPHVPAPAVDAIPGLDRDELTRLWGDKIFPAMSLGVRSVYRTGRWLDVEGGTAVFALEHPQFLQRGEDRRAEVEAALAAHFGARVGLRLVLDPGSAPAPSAAAQTTPRRAPRDGSGEPPPYDGPLPDRPPMEEEVSAEEFAELEVAPGAPASAEALLFQAFPGTEEVTR